MKKAEFDIVMMRKTNAFPEKRVIDRGVGKAPMTVLFEGMTLRDYFAAKAMVALMNDEGRDWDIITALAYRCADEMLVEREK